MKKIVIIIVFILIILLCIGLSFWLTKPVDKQLKVFGAPGSDDAIAWHIPSSISVSHVVENLPSQLYALSFEPRNITDEDIALIQCYPQITALSFIDCTFSDNLREINSIQELWFATRLKRTFPNGCENFLKSKHIKSVAVLNYVFLKEQKRCLFTNKPILSYLRITDSNIDDEDFKDICNLTNLKQLCLGSNQITGKNTFLLSRLKHLSLLSLAGMDMPNIKYNDFSDFSSSTRIELYRATIPEDEKTLMKSSKKNFKFDY